MADTGIWLYAVTRPRERWDGLTGVARMPVRPIDGAGLVALGSAVDLAEYGEAALKRNLEDLDWLDATARAHDQAVRAVTGLGATVPLRLATVYLDEDRVRAMLDTHRAELDRVLSQVDGRAEWGVKGYREANSPGTPAAAATSGTDYLRRRRAQLSAQRADDDTTKQRAHRIHETLSAFAVANRRHPLQDARLTGITAPMNLNGAYLIDDARAAEFGTLVAELDGQEPEIRLDLTGPWPPYSFAEVAR